MIMKYKVIKSYDKYLEIIDENNLENIIGDVFSYAIDLDVAYIFAHYDHSEYELESLKRRIHELCSE